MMPKAHIDRVDNLEMVERLGVVRSLTRKVRVVFDRDDNRPTDYNVLKVAMDLVTAEIGPAFSHLKDPDTNVTREGYGALVLVERHPMVVENDPGVVDVSLKYEHLLDGPHQLLQDTIDNPQPGLLFGKGKCSITEKTTNFYYPYGDHTRPRTQILVSHTFDKNETGVMGQIRGPSLPFTIVQGGEVSIPFPQSNFQLQGVLQTANPWLIGNRFINTINAEVWLTKPACTWICSEVSWDLINPENYLYRFGFEFQHNEDTWNPTVVFQDQRTGRPPAKVRSATLDDPTLPGAPAVTSYILHPFLPAPVPTPAGIWNVPALRRVNFPELFASFFEGVLIPEFI